MKKSIFNQNYSLLVLILLILFITYINIPNTINTNMRGGGKSSNPYDSMSEERLDKILMNQSVIYKILKNNFTIYIILIIILLIPTFYFANTLYLILGVPIAGMQPISWDSLGLQFLNNFVEVAKTKYGLYTPSTKSTLVTKKELDSFNKETEQLLAEANSAIDLFCNAVAPCNTCECRGPDPDYGGLPKNAPLVSYGGKNYNALTPSGVDNCVPAKNKVVESADGTTYITPSPDVANSLINSSAQSGAGDLQMSRIPNCCCNLFGVYGIDTSSESLNRFATAIDGNNVSLTDAAITPFIKKTPATVTAAGGLKDSTWPLGLSLIAGCEPLTDPSTVKISGKTSTGQATLASPYGTVNNTGDLISKYALNMFKSCLSKKPISYARAPTSDGEKVDVPQDHTRPNDGITPLDKNICECNGYDTTLDVGISTPFALNRTGLITKSTTTDASKYDLDIIVQKDVKVGGKSCGSWTTGLWNAQNKPAPRLDTSIPRKWLESRGPNWPSPMPTTPITGVGVSGTGLTGPHPAFSTSDIVTTYYYKLGTAFFYLKINNSIHEVDAYPLKSLDVLKEKYPYCKNEIKSTDVNGGESATKFINFGLTATLTGTTLNDAYYSKILVGHYVFPQA
jgi:hypothetical protein